MTAISRSILIPKTIYQTMMEEINLPAAKPAGYFSLHFSNKEEDMLGLQGNEKTSR
ncbi:hypothetical protein [Jeotgalibacillus proteolyticus]|uniref:hypothetical protein n=1 Tax=Jeotgalibacillus proteolyticus TaxID=2082395 RepID=UPI00142F9204|nr:hypothetical protein [Jeotgalibacillus proteolyticus]